MKLGELDSLSVSHNDDLPLDYIRYRAPIHHQPFGHLQGYGLDAITAYMVDGLVNLEVVISG